MHASEGYEGLAARGTPIADMAACANLFFAGSQAMETKFHGTTPALKRVWHFITMVSFCQEISEGSIDHENYICGGIDKPYAARPDVIEKPVVIIVSLLLCLIGADNSDGTRD